MQPSLPTTIYDFTSKHEAIPTLLLKAIVQLVCTLVPRRHFDSMIDMSMIVAHSIRCIILVQHKFIMLWWVTPFFSYY